MRKTSILFPLSEGRPATSLPHTRLRPRYPHAATSCGQWAFTCVYCVKEQGAGEPSLFVKAQAQPVSLARAGSARLTGESARNALDFPFWAPTVAVEGHAVTVTAAKREILD